MDLLFHFLTIQVLQLKLVDLMSLDFDTPNSPENLSDEVGEVDASSETGEVKPSSHEHMEEFPKKFEVISSSEEKIKFAIEYMKNSLAKEGNPDFKGFWGGKKTLPSRF